MVNAVAAVCVVGVVVVFVVVHAVVVLVVELGVRLVLVPAFQYLDYTLSAGNARLVRLTHMPGQAGPSTSN